MLEHYLAGGLRPRYAFAVREHLARCPECAALLQETKVVDALLATAPTVELASDFTVAAMDQVRAMAAPRRARPSPWAFLIVYLAAVWFAGFIWLTVTGQSVTGVTAAIVRHVAAVGSMVGSLAGSEHTLGHHAATVLAFGLVVLLLDVVLLIGLFIVHRVLRPHLAARVAGTPEVS